jgi:hypothetical protein
MLSMGQMLAALRQLEMKIGSALYQARLEINVPVSLGITLRALDEAQKELERLTEN